MSKKTRIIKTLRNGQPAANVTLNLPNIGQVTLDDEGSVEVEEETANLMVENGKNWLYYEDEEEEDEYKDEDEEEEKVEETKLADALEVFKLAELKGFALKGFDKDLTKSEDFKALKTKADFAGFIQDNWEAIDEKISEQILSKLEE